MMKNPNNITPELLEKQLDLLNAYSLFDELNDQLQSMSRAIRALLEKDDIHSSIELLKILEYLFEVLDFSEREKEADAEYDRMKELIKRNTNGERKS